MRKNFITIGSFDGVHAGHQHLFDKLKAFALEHNMTPLILAFAYPPRVAAGNSKNMSVITLPSEKFELISTLSGVKYKELDFNEIKDISRENFFNALVESYNMGGFLAGKDFAFGKDRLGNLDFLRSSCAQNGIVYEQAEFLQTGGHKISSSLIRKALHDGDIETVSTMLGRSYQITGKIIKGKQLGRTIGFPTANLQVDPHKILPHGIYAVEVLLGKEKLKGVCNIGLRPTVESNGLPLTEVHILDFNRDIYGRNLSINFIAKIRDEVKFESLGDLVQQINKDVICAYKILK